MTSEVPAVVGDEVPEALARSIRGLADEFVGVYAVETVERCVRDSFEQLARRATVASYLPLLAHRFARERLSAAVVHRGAEGSREVQGVLFVCSHNSGRSQMAAAWLEHLTAGEGVAVWSAGTDPGAEVSPAVAAAMLEVGIDLGAAFPKPLTDEVIGAADVVVTMGCGEACPVLPGRRYEDWLLAHSVGDTVDDVRSARDEIRDRVELLLGSLRPVAS